jgi:hypothetical protein
MRRPCRGLCWSVPISADSACNIGRHSAQRTWGRTILRRSSRLKLDGVPTPERTVDPAAIRELAQPPAIREQSPQHRMRSLHATNVPCVIRFTQSSETFHNRKHSCRGTVSQKRPFLTHLTEVSRPASSGSAAVSDCISKPMSHKVVGFLGFETHAQMKLIFPVTFGRRGHSGQHCCKPYVGLATFTVNTYHTF